MKIFSKTGKIIIMIRILCFIITLTCPALAYSQDNAPAQQKQLPVFEDATFENFAALYWDLGLLDESNNEHIDHYAMVTECDIYQKYRPNELEWEEIREAIKIKIQQEIKDIPEGLVFDRVIHLSEYDPESSTFQLAKRSVAENINQLEIVSDAFGNYLCGEITESPHYPKAILADLSVPFSFTEIQVTPEFGENLVNMSSQKLANQPENSNATIEDFRKIYIQMFVRIYALADEQDTYGRVRVKTILEGYNVYADPDKTEILLSRTLRQKKPPSDFEKELIAAYQARGEGDQNGDAESESPPSEQPL